MPAPKLRWKVRIFPQHPRAEKKFQGWSGLCRALTNDPRFASHVPLYLVTCLEDRSFSSPLFLPSSCLSRGIIPSSRSRKSQSSLSMAYWLPGCPGSTGQSSIPLLPHRGAVLLRYGSLDDTALVDRQSLDFPPARHSYFLPSLLPQPSGCLAVTGQSSISIALQPTIRYFLLGHESHLWIPDPL